jgi:hypothetical protein
MYVMLFFKGSKYYFQLNAHWQIYIKASNPPPQPKTLTLNMATGMFAETLKSFKYLRSVFPKAELIHLSIKFDQNPQIWIGHT